MRIFVPYSLFPTGCISFLLLDLVGGMGILVERASCPFHFQTGYPNTGGRAEN
ncbi:MAG: hypothetical protein F6K55_04055 [Moorea sp. SIO4A3]|nr:hypothetical protein [Moorena sp. SIO4A3]